MLSIIVDDALNGVDISKRYPAFYAKMLIDDELRTAFLDTLEILEMSRRGELLEYDGPQTIDLSFLEKTNPKIKVRNFAKNKWQLILHSSLYQLRKMFDDTSPQLAGAYRSDDLLSGEKFLTVMNGVVEVGDQEVEIKVDIGKNPLEPEHLKPIVVVFVDEEMTASLEATIKWGSYEETVRGNQLGLVRFPAIRTDQVYDSAGNIDYDLDCYVMLSDAEE